jgi:hypothetical protein
VRRRESFARAVAPTEEEESMLKMALFVLVGALLGYGNYRWIGCKSGACPITGNPYISTLYGAVIGYLLSGGVR